MKVVQLPSSYFPNSVGGTEVYVHQLSTVLAECGVECIVAHHNANPGKPEGPLRYRVEVLPQIRNASRAELYSNSMKEEPPGFRALLERESPDLVHFHAFSLGAGCDQARIVRELKIPYLITYHTPAMSCPRGTLARWGSESCDGKLDAKTCSGCLLQRDGWPKPIAKLLGLSQLSALSLPDGKWTTTLCMNDLAESWKTSWSEFFNGAAHIVSCAKWCKEVLASNGVPEEKISVARQALPGETKLRELKLPLPQDRKIKIGFVGRVTKVKAPDFVLRVVRALNKTGIAAECHIVGPIPPHEKKWTEGLFEEYDDVATYHGSKTGNELTSWIQSIDLMLLPGLKMETGPLVLLEAWNQGVPVIGVNGGGIREHLVEANLSTLLFEPDDIESAVQAVLRARRWKENTRPSVRIEGMDLLGKKILEYYRAALQLSTAMQLRA